MIDVLPADWAVPLAVVLVCLGLLRWALQGSGSVKAGPEPKDEIVLAEEFPDLQVPQDLHVEVALDPPTGLHHSNSYEPYKFQNNNCEGSYLFFHKPTGPNSRRMPTGLNYGDYFNGKKRLWEYRVQLRFHAPIPADEEMYFGIELEEYVPLSSASKKVAALAVTAVRKAVGPVYHSVGDDPKKVSGEVERPTCVLPLWAFDQFIETPPGEEPPNLQDPKFPELGKRRYQRIKAYAQEIADLRQRMQPGTTYTFAFWGNSRWLDVINWRLTGLPMVPSMDFSHFAGCPPIHVALYGLTPQGDGPDAETRHLQRIKRYYFLAAVWTNEHRPERRRFESLVGAEALGLGVLGPEAGPAKKRSLRSRLSRFMKSQINCCTARPR